MTEGGPPIHFIIEGLERVQGILRQDWKKVIQRACLKVGALVQRQLETFPPDSHQPVIWQSERQRRWWHASRAEAGLDIKYTRESDPWSKRLHTSWTTREQGDSGSVVSTFVDYAPYVQADAAQGGIRQQPQHFATGWVTDKQAVDTVKASGDVPIIVKAEIEDALKG